MELEKSHEDLMKIAVAEAEEAVKSGDGRPFGGVIYNPKTKILIKAHNLLYKDTDPTAHGEVTVIRKACSELKTPDLSGYVLYTSSYPCPMCLGAAMFANIEKIYYCASVEDAAEFGFKDKKFYEFLQNDEHMNRYAKCVELAEKIRPFQMWKNTDWEDVRKVLGKK